MRPTSERAPHDHGHNLEHRHGDDRRHWPGRAHPTTTRDHDQGGEAESQVPVHAAVGDAARLAAPPRQRRRQRPVAVGLEGVMGRGVEGSRLDVVARLGAVADVEVVGRVEHVIEDPGQRLGERRRRVLHARRLDLSPAPPRLGPTQRPALGQLAHRCREHHGDDQTEG